MIKNIILLQVTERDDVGGVKIYQKLRDVIYGRTLNILVLKRLFHILKSHVAFVFKKTNSLNEYFFSFLRKNIATMTSEMATC